MSSFLLFVSLHDTLSVFGIKTIDQANDSTMKHSHHYIKMYSERYLARLTFTMKRYTVLLFCLTVFFLFADQNLLAPNLSLIAHEFGFDDQERDEKLGGYIAFGFFIVGAPIALLVGYFTDLMNRCTLFGLVVVLGSTSSLSTYWVRNYTELFICRIFTGISIGGINPVIFSLLGDLYPGSSRIHVSTLIGISQSAGIAAGQFLAGMVGPSLGWRTPFIMVAVPSIVCALLVFFTVSEPKRGDQEKAVRHFRETQTRTITTDLIYSYHKDTTIPNEREEGLNPICPDVTYAVAAKETAVAEEVQGGSPSSSPDPHDSDIHYTEKIECNKIIELLQTPSAVIIFVQGFPGCLPWGMIFVFLNDYFSSDRGMSIEAATAALTLFGIGGLFGQFLGGWLGQKLYNQDPRFQTLLMGASTMASIGPILYLINAPTFGDPLFYIVAFFGGVVVNINGPNVRAVLQNVCKPEVRGSAFAFFALADDIGKGLGPALVVLFIQAFSGDRREAFNFVVLFWIFCGSMLLLLSLTVVADENLVQKSIKESLMRRSSMGGNAEYNPIHSPDLRSQTAYMRMIDEHSPPKASSSRSHSHSPSHSQKIGVSEITEKITIEYETKEKIIFHSKA